MEIRRWNPAKASSHVHGWVVFGLIKAMQVGGLMGFFLFYFVVGVDLTVVGSGWNGRESNVADMWASR